MEEENQKSHRVSRKDQSGSHWSQGADEEPRARCSGKRCRSWAAAAIADCVALCCCPCAVVNIFTLAFVKVPWMIGRKCIGRGGPSKKRMKKINREDRFHHHHHHRRSAEMVSGGCCGGGDGDGEFDDHRFVVERDGSLTKEEAKTASLKEEEETRISARVEAERVWLELYQIGHLGFGRVSFTGIHQ
ncbi:hypothetical protein ISN44_As03g000710 [Arabidopsis suecica]|uniref:At3g01516 n=2 Tax=Arabidopsis TaxID=3701 RepID=Q6NLE5_ARATH|nr:uncharacterized protein AT3G01516 [Arabidopsis thaliana]NP_683522.1 uncharacterized protein AT3G01516 [Arabidopsis thaliana]KAG7629642.1 hypothetical protein ISN44_As03g000710 [Arabidopsis suecica]AAS76693.1 At3g01516 [Arabidopsis thaliana]AAS88779.1 At3g01516 [Arabidopsis thaliana]AEE73680.1 transmembrane protein [Arabidopsis thaliana]ANM63330.1 transmembrane protein [Arabidopsis thaliana]|eukprot:NP_001319442.1 transmembrane protein [Arabidopsis thaliana]